MQGEILFHLHAIGCLHNSLRRTFGKVNYQTYPSEDENKHGTLPPMRSTCRITAVLNCTHCWANTFQSLTFCTQNYFGIVCLFSIVLHSKITVGYMKANPIEVFVSNFTSGFYLVLQQRESFLRCFNICCCTCSENEVVSMKFHTKIIYNYLPSTRECTRPNSCKEYLMLF